MTENTLRRVLIVDDEPHIVSAVQRELRAPAPDGALHAVEGFVDPLQALRRAHEVEFAVVISDYRMPEMDGLQLLKALAQIQPDCVRIVLSGQTDKEALVRMVNETRIYRFIPKPWRHDHLKGLVAQALEYHDEQREHRRLTAQVGRFDRALLRPEAVERVLIVAEQGAERSNLERALTQRAAVDMLLALSQNGLTGTLDGHPAAAAGQIEVLTAATPQQALAVLAVSEVGCVIADHRMQEISELEFLQQCAERQPDCARLLICDDLAAAELTAAVNLARVFAFIDQPWQDFDIRAAVAQALAQRRLIIENRFLADLLKTDGAVIAN